MGSKGTRYRDGYKYQLAEDYELKIGITPEEDVWTNFIELSAAGDLLRKGYAWNGPSGPAVDTRKSIRGFRVHEALLRRHCHEAGMSWL